MKKSNIATFFLGAALLCGAPACTDLGEDVYDSIPSDQFGKTQEEINSIIAPIYKTLKNMWPGDMMCMIEESSDMGISPTRIGGDWWDGGAHMEMQRRTWTSMNNLFKNSWNSCMEGVSTCNQVYYIVENSTMEEELKQRTLGEIRGIRAYWYYVLIDNFGNAPLVTDFTDTSLPGMTSRADLFNFVVTELNDIKDKVRDDITSASYGKFTKGAAYTLLAKMYLNAQEWTGKAEWQKAADACDVVMSLGYIIEPDWKISFAVDNQVSKETILQVPFSKGDGGNFIHNRTLHYKDPIALGFTKGVWNGMSAQPDYVKAFDPADKRYEGSFLLGKMIDPATGKVLITDHGRELNHIIDFDVFGQDKYDGLWGEVNQEDGARCNKWVYEAGMNNTDMENDYAIFRLADVYLMKAEALVRLNKDMAEATRLVNAIRTRAFGDDTHNYTMVDLEKVYKERRFELAWELYSRQDMIRFDKFAEPGYLRPEITPAFRKLFPIPFTAWQTNQNLKQNPGYPAF